MLNLIHSNRTQLLDYVSQQLNHFFPDQSPDVRPAIDRHLDHALARLEYCINAVKMWRAGEFDYLQSTQYAFFLYFLSNTIWKAEREQQRVCTKLFYLNKALNGIDCFYEIALPPVFFIGHTVGIVLAKATYGNYLVMYQNSTVGKNHGVAPELGEGVIMYPNSAIIGNCKIADRSVIAQGVSVINKDTQENCLAFQGVNGELLFKSDQRDILRDFFRI